MEGTAEWDVGRTHMERIMKRKAETWKAREDCVASKTCPEQLQRPSEGAFVCDESGHAGDIPCLNIDQSSFLNFADMGYGDAELIFPDRAANGNDVWGWTDPQTGREYAIMGFTGGTAFVDVSEPTNPVPVGFMYSGGWASTWRDIKVIGNYAYIGSEALNHGLQVFDLTHLRGRTTNQVFTPDAINGDFGSSHNIVANEDTNFIYVVGARQERNYPQVCAGGLLVIDVSDPLNPTTVGCFGGDGYVHDAQCVIYHGPDARYQGHELCFCFNEDSLTIVDVSDKGAMRMIAKSGYVNAAYTHQGWLTEDHKIVLLDDELDEQDKPEDEQFTKTYVWDVTDLLNPELKTIFQSSERSIDHNQYIIGDFTFQANYESGLRILHIDRDTNVLSLAAYFDVFPSRTTAEFNGAWSVYPYFKSGTVVISSIDYGLFVVRPNWEAIDQLVASGATYAQQTRTRPAAVGASGAYCPLRTESRTCAAPVLC
jgi:choice-of-anchor B domain-containing protein